MTRGGRSMAHRRAADAGAGMLPASHAGADPVNLLDVGASRQLVQAAGGKVRRQHGGDGGPDFVTNAAGQMIIKVCFSRMEPLCCCTCMPWVSP